jgi:beta-xylosidase
MKTYTNPVWAKDFPDPFLLEYKGKFYAYATETAGHRFQVMESPDLVHWTHRGTAFTVPWSNEHYWAPEVYFYREQFYMTYSARNPTTGKHDIGIATAKSPRGPFTHQAILARGDANRVGVIDATIYFESGTPYLIYSEEEPRRIVVRKMQPDLLGLEGETIELLRPDRDWERGVTEAPTLIKRNGLYHLFYSAGWYESSRREASYCVAHAVAQSLFGPYEKTGAILATLPGRVYGPGHQCLLTLRSGETWLAYHGWDDQKEPRYGSNPLGRTLRIDRLIWSGEKPFVEGPSLVARPAPRLQRDSARK